MDEQPAPAAQLGMYCLQASVCLFTSSLSAVLLMIAYEMLLGPIVRPMRALSGAYFISIVLYTAAMGALYLYGYEPLHQFLLSSSPASSDVV